MRRVIILRVGFLLPSFIVSPWTISGRMPQMKVSSSIIRVVVRALMLLKFLFISFFLFRFLFIFYFLFFVGFSVFYFRPRSSCA